jgi:hypothetical protein
MKQVTKSMVHRKSEPSRQKIFQRDAGGGAVERRITLHTSNNLAERLKTIARSKKVVVEPAYSALLRKVRKRGWKTCSNSVSSLRALRDREIGTR